jgi:hypothetical protein
LYKPGSGVVIVEPDVVPPPPGVPEPTADLKAATIMEQLSVVYNRLKEAV